jgi:hypothetical protein
MFVHSAINCTQIHILKPNGVFSSNYYSYKSKVHNMQLQAMVDHHKCFCNVFVKLSKSMNNSKILWLSSLYQKTTSNNLFDLEHGAQDGIFPYILGDKGYLLLLMWLMIPQKQNIYVRHTILEAAYNKHHSRGRSLIENAFGILKKTFK